MILRIAAFVLLLLLTCCGTKDDQFCKCLNTSESLNNFSSELLNREIKEGDTEKLKELRNAKDKACENYNTLSAGEAMEKRKQCN